MSVETQPVLTDDDLNGTDREILDLLHEGRVTPPYTRDALGKSREYSSERLIRLNEHDHVRRLAPGLYELVDDPRSDVTLESEADLRGRLQDAHERVDDLEVSLASAREDRQEHKELLEDCQDRLGDAPDTTELRRAIDDLEVALENGNGDVDVAIRRLKEAAGVE